MESRRRIDPVSDVEIKSGVAVLGALVGAGLLYASDVLHSPRLDAELSERDGRIEQLEAELSEARTSLLECTGEGAGSAGSMPSPNARAKTE